MNERDGRKQMGKDENKNEKSTRQTEQWHKSIRDRPNGNDGKRGRGVERWREIDLKWVEKVD